ncbi:MAG TPA: hypothetical protein DCL61_04585 [Cyanobacteria bacterium UBA12227]|nr:hypothetical protein [Cyanobacteria bacterium UBA12227]
MREYLDEVEFPPKIDSLVAGIDPEREKDGDFCSKLSVSWRSHVHFVVGVQREINLEVLG